MAVTEEFARSIVRVDIFGIVVCDEDGIQGLLEDCSPVGQKDLPLAGGIQLSSSAVSSMLI